MGTTTNYCPNTFFLGTKARFKGCKRPKRNPDYISRDRYGDISSEYWYGLNKKGPFVIRSSNHWSNSNIKESVFSCKKIRSCYWYLVTNSSTSQAGKAYFSDFEINK